MVGERAFDYQVTQIRNRIDGLPESFAWASIAGKHQAGSAGVEAVANGGNGVIGRQGRNLSTVQCDCLGQVNFSIVHEGLLGRWHD